MLASSLVVFFAALAAANQGWTVPPHHKDGVYSVSISTNGEPTHTHIRSIDETVIAARSSNLLRRGSPYSVNCGNYGLNANDMEKAARGIRDQCRRSASVKPNKDFYTVSGGVVCYYCDFAKGSVCKAREMDEALRLVEGACGRYQSGWQNIQGHGQYGCEAKGKKFCGRGILLTKAERVFYWRRKYINKRMVRFYA